MCTWEVGNTLIMIQMNPKEFRGNIPLLVVFVASSYFVLQLEGLLVLKLAGWPVLSPWDCRGYSQASRLLHANAAVLKRLFSYSLLSPYVSSAIRTECLAGTAAVNSHAFQ